MSADKQAVIINDILRDVAELPDRTSPEDQPHMMLVTVDELRAILDYRIGEGASAEGKT